MGIGTGEIRVGVGVWKERVLGETTGTSVFGEPCGNHLHWKLPEI